MLEIDSSQNKQKSVSLIHLLPLADELCRALRGTKHEKNLLGCDDHRVTVTLALIVTVTQSGIIWGQSHTEDFCVDLAYSYVLGRLL